MDATLLSMIGLLVALALAAYLRGGTELLVEGLGSGGSMLRRFALVFAVALLAAGLAEKLVPHEAISRVLGEQSGWRGLLLATGAGMLTPSGPFISFPIAAALLESGASPAAVVTYIAAWMLLAVHRFFVWEVPFLGVETAVARWLVCAALPLLAGIATRAVLLGR